MTILFAGNTPPQVSPDGTGFSYSTSTEHRDANFVPGDTSFLVEEFGETLFDVALDSVSTDFWLHYRFRAPSGLHNAANHRFLKIMDIDDNELLRFEGDGGDNWIDVVGDSTSTDGSFRITGGVNYTIDIHVVVDGSTDITGELFVGGVKRAEAVAANTGAKGGVAYVRWENYNMVNIAGGLNTDYMHVSEIIMTDAEPTVGWRLAQLDPDAVGHYAEFSGDYANITDGNVLSGMSGASSGDRMSHELSAYSGPGGATVRAVIGTVVAAKGSSGPTGLKQSLRASSTDYDGSSVALTDTPRPYCEVWDTNPDTATDWGVSDFSDFEVGVVTES